MLDLNGRKIRSALLYTALAVLANTAQAETPDIAALRSGDMAKLAVHAEPMAASDVAFETFDGQEMTLAAFEGKITLVNFWATWCAPCREEMPSLSALQSELGGEDFEVVTIATGRNAPAAIERFLEEIGAANLPKHTDRKQQLSRAMGVLGLPITVILDREGNEIARLQGDADWNSDSAKAIMKALIAG